MFCYQFSTATKNLMDPLMVDFSYERDIINDDVPLIVVCPTNQIDRELIFTDFQYLYGLEDLLKGNIYCDDETFCVSWGGHLNLTFDELKTKAFYLNIFDNTV